jgi:hypothetical protein
LNSLVAFFVFYRWEAIFRNEAAQRDFSRSFARPAGRIGGFIPALFLMRSPYRPVVEFPETVDEKRVQFEPTNLPNAGGKAGIKKMEKFQCTLKSQSRNVA